MTATPAQGIRAQDPEIVRSFSPAQRMGSMCQRMMGGMGPPDEERLPCRGEAVHAGPGDEGWREKAPDRRRSAAGIPSASPRPGSPTGPNEG